MNHKNTASSIISASAHVFDVPESAIKSKSRKREHVMPRQVAMYLILENTTLSLKAVGRLFSRDHSTVIHARKSIENALDTTATMRPLIKAVLDKSDVAMYRVARERAARFGI